jgi:hypothetical protein
VGTFGQPISVALRDRIAARVEQARGRGRGYPPDALDTANAVLVYATEAMFAYYLGDDGAVYVMDMDTSRGAEVATSVSTIREVYARAIDQFPELGELREVAVVERVDPQVGLLEGFHANVGLWNEAGEPRELAIARCARYFARRLHEPGPAYVVQRLPSPANGTFLTLELAGTEPVLELELHVVWRGATTIELVQRGTRDAIAARLCADDLASTVIALEQAVIGRG